MWGSSIGVIQLDSYNSCMNCKACVETINKPIDNCSKCSMLQRVDKCTKRLSAKLLFDSAGSYISLHAVTSILMRMILKQLHWLRNNCWTFLVSLKSHTMNHMSSLVFFCLKVLSGEFYFHKPITVRIELYFCYRFIHFLLFVSQYWLRKSW